MPRDERGRRAYLPPTPAGGWPPTPYVDYLLRFVLERCEPAGDAMSERLDALERTIVALTRPWRDDAPLAPARELRASSETIDALLGWVERGGRPDPRDLARLGVYASGALTDGDVPEGWVRVRLRA
ncbi:MAG TPA: hypothetical protein VL328_00105 [Gemmatimonadaceae bacterium]|nr:hypothetical protein [Gemmatimonadaceae bacterium]